MREKQSFLENSQEKIRRKDYLSVFNLGIHEWDIFLLQCVAAAYYIFHCMFENNKVIFLIEFTVFYYFIRLNLIWFGKSSDIRLYVN